MVFPCLYHESVMHSGQGGCLYRAISIPVRRTGLCQLSSQRETTFMKYLQDGGYYTAVIGKQAFLAL